LPRPSRPRPCAHNRLLSFCQQAEPGAFHTCESGLRTQCIDGAHPQKSDSCPPAGAASLGMARGRGCSQKIPQPLHAVFVAAKGEQPQEPRSPNSAAMVGAGEAQSCRGNRADRAASSSASSRPAVRRIEAQAQPGLVENGGTRFPAMAFLCSRHPQEPGPIMSAGQPKPGNSQTNGPGPTQQRSAPQARVERMKDTGRESGFLAFLNA